MANTLGMPEYYCPNCHRVFLTHSPNPKCCDGSEVVAFDYTDEKQVRSLIGGSNAWRTVWEKWKAHPKLEIISFKLAEDGCFSAAASLNGFIETLLEEAE